MATLRPSHRASSIALALSSLLGFSATAAGSDSVVIVQESNGFPGGERATRPSRQKISIREGQLRVLDPAHLWALFISTPEQQVREAAVGLHQYEERSFASYAKYRQERAENLARQARDYQREVSKAGGDAKRLRELQQEYTHMGGDPQEPGRVQAKLQHLPGDAKRVTLLVDRVEREITLEHYLVRENQREQPAFDLWVTSDVTLPIDLLSFYRGLLPFGPEVDREVAKVPGTVVECLAVVDTGTFHRTYRSKVLEIRHEDVAPEEVAIPAGWTKVEPGAPAAPAADEVTCAMDGKRLPRDSAQSYTDRGATKRTWYVCSSEERKALLRLLLEGKTPPFAGGER